MAFSTVDNLVKSLCLYLGKINLLTLDRAPNINFFTFFILGINSLFVDTT